MRTSNAVARLSCQRYWEMKSDSQEGIWYEGNRRNVEHTSVEVQNQVSTFSV